MRSVVEVLNSIIDRLDGDNNEFTDYSEVNRYYRWAGSLKRAVRYIKALEDGRDDATKLLMKTEDERKELRLCISCALDELKMLCPGNMTTCEGKCSKQESNPCEYYGVWVALGEGKS
jgi:hypothetical protein